MNKIQNVLLWLGILLISVACVDDYFEANPPLPLDSPYSVLTVDDTELTGGESTNFTVRVVDAPGLVDSVAYITTDDKGTVVFDQGSLNSVIGSESGTFTGTFTAPYDASGPFTLTIVVFDAQGEQMKSHTMSETLTLTYLLDAPTFTLGANDAVLTPGESTTVNIDIEALGGIEDVRIFSNFGQVVLDTASLDAVRGEETGVVLATYTAPSTPTSTVGPVTFTAFVVDQLQGRETRVVTDVEAPEVTVEYTLPAPQITVSGSNVVRAGTHEYVASITAPGVISDIEVSANISTRDEEIGTITIDDEALEALIGQTSGELPISIALSGFIGYVDLNITVTDEQGRVTTETYRIRIDP
ncbi:hypothetical protein [Cesiribacter andamanensis]|uniref:Uncharacterized protein n=1 Tax=Cesiribacter andamanensis AMV16 TaxID=1279009 RepID=M7NRM6_9BACT|nr:hypothetical protein [Cesiribacter andamanensis]EMR01154.1 hypothetical protein ADICEAN_03719 [Cesiribacter andamanensis AMV16]